MFRGSGLRLRANAHQTRKKWAAPTNPVTIVAIQIAMKAYNMA